MSIEKPPQQPSPIHLNVPSIHCPSCKTHIQSILATYEIQKLDIDINRHCITFEGPWTSQRVIERALAAVGYNVEHEQTLTKSTQSSIFALLSRRFFTGRRERKLRQEHIKHCIKCQIELGLAGSNPEMPLEGIVVLPSSPIPRLQQTILGVEGMTCASCTHSIESAISPHPAVQQLSVNLLQNSMKVIYDASALTPQGIIQMVEDCGFEASEWETQEAETAEKAVTASRDIQVKIDGMFCGECPPKINAHLAALPISSFTPLSLTHPVTTITYVPSPKFTVRSILEGLPVPFTGTVHHPPSFYSRSRAIQAREVTNLTRLFLISTAVAIPTFIIGIVGMVLLPSTNLFRQWCESRSWWSGASRGVILLWALATIVQFGVGHIFYQRAFMLPWSYSGGWRKWRPSKLVRFNMDLLVALSTTVAYFSSIAITVQAARTHSHGGMDSYFDSCVFLIFFILMGRVLEGRARVSTGDAIAMLDNMRPETAFLVHETDQGSVHQDSMDGASYNSAGPYELSQTHTREIPVDLLEIGDHILLRPGASPPADATIIHGSTTTDESSLTGESLPVSKSPGDQLLTGTTNLTSPVLLRVDVLGSETALQKIVRAVSEAQNTKAPIEMLADRITAIFVPFIITLALVVLCVWLGLALSDALPSSYYPDQLPSMSDRAFFAVQFFIAVLVIACPCGIGLAAPTAHAVGSGLAARMGVLAQGGGEAFQRATEVDTVVFDKTGTLTTGETTVVNGDILWPQDRAWILEAVRALESGSSHPLATAVVRHCISGAEGLEKPILSIGDCEEVPGKGVRGTVTVANRQYTMLVGSEAFLGPAIYPDGYDSATLEAWKSLGRSVVVVGVLADSESPTIVARFCISDTLRPEAKSAVTSLRNSGKEVWMLTGDNTATANAVAQSLGIALDKVVAGVLPHEKSGLVRRLQERPVLMKTWFGATRSTTSTVLFCGDGLNDSAAIVAASVGIALSHGSQVTLTGASFVLLQSRASLTTIGSLLHLSRKVYMRQKLNFGWAMVYNVAMIPLAAGVFSALQNARIPPVWAALAMALSSLSVVMSSLALKWGL